VRGHGARLPVRFAQPMKAAELYKILRGELDSWFKERGFKRHRSSGLAYQKPHDTGFVMVWFQCDKWGWDKWAGSSFFVNVTLSATLDPWSGRMERLNAFMTDEELERARELRNDVVARIPVPPESYFAELWAVFSRRESGEALLQTVRDEFRPATMPYSRRHDLMLRYFRPTDVIAWAAFIRAPLARGIAGMTEPAPGTEQE
jgi:hypothetical protein